MNVPTIYPLRIYYEERIRFSELHRGKYWRFFDRVKRPTARPTDPPTGSPLTQVGDIYKNVVLRKFLVADDLLRLQHDNPSPDSVGTQPEPRPCITRPVPRTYDVIS